VLFLKARPEDSLVSEGHHTEKCLFFNM